MNTFIKQLKKTTYSIGKTVVGSPEHTDVSYKDYITSGAWKERAKLERQKNPRCSLCNRRVDILQVHHRTYVRLGNEGDGDLVVLCQGCHEMFHKHYQYSREIGCFVPKKKNHRK